MLQRIAPLGLVLLAMLGASLASQAPADQPAKGKPASLNELSMEVAALQTLYQFRFTPAQLETLKAMGKETSQEAGARTAAKVSEGFRKSLIDLRDALVDSRDDERIDKLQEQREKLRDTENPELDDGIEITDEAREKAPEVLKQLSARQVAGFVALYGDQFPDPVERLLEAVGRVRGLDAKQWKQIREDVADDVGRLTAGLDTEKAAGAFDQVVQLLIQVRALNDAEFKNQRPALEKKARQIVGKVGPFDVMRNVAEQVLAELLANPRLAAAIDARLRK
jgi:hypothetical protein